MQTIELRVWTGNRMQGHKEAMRLLYNKACGLDWSYFESMLFTGKLDRAGKKIFAGDLISAIRSNSSLGDMGDLYKVVYSERYGAFCLECVKSDNDFRIGKIAMTSGERPYLIDSKLSVIVGNIFENPEMIKQ
jgi:hypothetical protein